VNKRHCLLALLLLTLVSSPVLTAPLQLVEGVYHYNAGLHLDILEDTQGRWTIDDVASEMLAARFQPSTEDAIHVGGNNSIFWLRLTINPSPHSAGDWLLFLDTLRLNYVDFYVDQNDGYRTILSGDKRPYKQRDVVHPKQLLRLSLSSSAPQTVYLRLQHNVVNKLPITLWSEREFWQQGNSAQVQDAVFIAALLTMLLYNAALAISLRDKSYAYYVCFLSSFLFTVAYYGNHIQGLLLQDSVWWDLRLLCYALMFGWMVQCSAQILNLKFSAPHWYRIKQAIIAVWSALLILVYFMNFSGSSPELQIILPVTGLLMLISVLFVIVAGVIRWRQGYAPALTFVLSWAILTAALLVVASTGFTPPKFAPSTMIAVLQAAMFFQLMLFSLALSQKILVLRQENLLAQHQLAQELNMANAELEQRVVERTRDLELTKNKAESANSAKSAFLADMSHEIRTPLNAILGFSELMREERSATQQQREWLDIINDAGRHLLALINDVLDIAKIEAGRIKLAHKVFSPKELFEGVEQLFRDKARAKRLDLKFDGIDQLTAFIETDEAKVRQILVNLIGNALKFTEQGSVYCRALAIPVGNNTLRLEVEVIDTGPGIAEAELDKVFSSFQQTQSGRETEGGTGLGMAISREYAQLMGGDISVTSQLNTGSRFLFTIVAPMAENPHGDSKRQTIQALNKDFVGTKILIVDDKVNNRQLLIDTLQPLGFNISQACDGQQAVAQFAQEPTDLVLMDRRMPVMDGIEAARRIKATKAGCDTPIIALTASAFEEQREELLASGLDDFLSKPFQRQALLQMIARHLSLDYDYSSPDDITEAGESSQIGKHAEDNTPQQQAKILVVDDAPVNRMLLKKILTNEGYQIEEAGDGREAMEKIAEWQPAIVLLDIQMPIMDGYEVLRLLHREDHREDDGQHHPIVIAVTAENDSAEQAMLREMGAADIAQKPIVAAEIKALLDHYLS